jgi:hypothetical protein
MIELTGDPKQDAAIILPHKIRKIYYSCDVHEVNKDEKLTLKPSSIYGYGNVVSEVNKDTNKLTFKVSLYNIDLFELVWTWSDESKTWQCTTCESLMLPTKITELVNKTKI